MKTNPALIDIEAELPDRPTVLAVDDSRSVRDIIVHVLNEKYEVVLAKCGEEALELVPEVHPEVILSDIHMPGIDGITLTERLKSDPVTKNIPVVLLTGTHEEVVVITSLNKGADDYLKKPIGEGELLARVGAAHRQYRTYLKVERSNRALERANAELIEAQGQLLQAQKLEAIGRLAAGVAHEINTPLQYVGDNIAYVHDSLSSFERVVDVISLADPTDPDIASKTLSNLKEFVEREGLVDLMTEVPDALEESRAGVVVLSDLVAAMKEFSHPGGKDKVETEINPVIDNTLVVARNEWKYAAEVETDLATDLPLVPLVPGELNQVILNLVINAAHAIEDGPARGSDRGKIRISSKSVSDAVEIRIRDDGPGIPPEVQDKVFEPFFTTKEVGRGTGQGLAIARSVVVDKHGGELFFKTKPGLGTEFVIRIPFDQEPVPATESDLEPA